MDLHTASPRRIDHLTSVLDREPTVGEAVVAPRVMVVEARDPGRAAVLLAAEGLTVETTDGTPDTVVESAATFDPHLVLLEVGAITDAVVGLCSRLEQVIGAPIVVFSDRREEAEVIAGYAAGARSVVSEPVGGHEFVARVRAVLRRARVRESAPNPESPREVFVVGPVVLDRSRRVVTVDGEVVPMPRREFEIADMLISRAGTVVARATLLRELWGTSADTKSLAVQVGRLRARLAAAEGRSRIVTVRGVGYRFLATDEDVADAATGVGTGE